MNRNEIAVPRAFWSGVFSAGAEIWLLQGSLRSAKLRNGRAEMHLIYPPVLSKEWGEAHPQGWAAPASDC